MSDRYILKSGQINFEDSINPGRYACVVIKNGEVHNMTDELRKLMMEKLVPTGPFAEEQSFEKMFD